MEYIDMPSPPCSFFLELLNLFLIMASMNHVTIQSYPVSITKGLMKPLGIKEIIYVQVTLPQYIINYSGQHCHGLIPCAHCNCHTSACVINI